MNNDRVNDLLTLSKSMLECAQKDDWESVERLVQDRQTMLRDFNSFSANAALDTLQQLLAYETQLLNLAEAEKEKTQNALKKCHKAKQAKQLYSE